MPEPSNCLYIGEGSKERKASFFMMYTDFFYMVSNQTAFKNNSQVDKTYFAEARMGEGCQTPYHCLFQITTNSLEKYVLSAQSLSTISESLFDRLLSWDLFLLKEKHVYNWP